MYLVGGCVRDLILDRPPKDFDIITSAQLKEVCLYLSPPKCKYITYTDIEETLLADINTSSNEERHICI